MAGGGGGIKIMRDENLRTAMARARYIVSVGAAARGAVG